MRPMGMKLYAMVDVVMLAGGLWAVQASATD